MRRAEVAGLMVDEIVDMPTGPAIEIKANEIRGLEKQTIRQNAPDTTGNSKTQFSRVCRGNQVTRLSSLVSGTCESAHEGC